MTLSKSFLAFRINWLVALVILLVSCDDTTNTLGVDMMPASDFVTKQYTEYDVITASYPVGDSVLARSSTSYLGRYTDPETGTVVTSDFLAQFHCTEGFAFPDSVTDHRITSADIRLFITDYVGDSLATFKLSIYPLTQSMDADEFYYTNINPARFYDTSAQPIATKWFTISDRTISDEQRWSSDYNRHIRISLPTTFGQQIYEAWRANPQLFNNAEAWLNSQLPGSKGFYFQLESGDGAMAYIDIAQFNIYFNYYDEEYAKDTTGVCQFASTEEVVQATHFQNAKLDNLIADTQATYLKSPAGMFTIVTLPTDQINPNDTINTASIAFQRYNDRVNSPFKLSIPQRVLMVRLDDYNDLFFEKYTLPDNITSYLTTFDSTSNTYEFNNIARLITTILHEKQEGTASPNADKVLLIPVEATYDSSKNLVKLTHDFSLSSTRLVGGDTDRVKLKVIYSHYRK